MLAASTAKTQEAEVPAAMFSILSHRLAIVGGMFLESVQGSEMPMKW